MLIDGRLTRTAAVLQRHPVQYGVTVHDPDRAFDGATLFCPAWGHLAFLITLEGLVVHTWNLPRSNLVELLPSGNLFTHEVGRRLVELGPDGSEVWRWESDEPLDSTTHHDFWVGDDVVWTLAKHEEPGVPGLFEPGLAPERLRSDLLLKIGRDGRLLERIALRDHVDTLLAFGGLERPLRYTLRQVDGVARPVGLADWAHANSLEVLPTTPLGERDPRFRAGNLLVSLRNLDLVAIFDPEARRFVWAWGPGTLDAQHHPNLLANGHLVVFDNGSCRGHSIVREIDPREGTTVWQYEDPGNFFSPKRGSAQRLPNGNTLICEADRGRLFEVTRDHAVVWEYWSPFLAQGARHLGRRIYRATRYAPHEIEPLLAQRPDRIAGHKFSDGTKIRRLPQLLDVTRQGWT